MRFLNGLVEFTKYLTSIVVDKVTTRTNKQPEPLPEVKIPEKIESKEIDEPVKDPFAEKLEIGHKTKDSDGLEYWRYDALEKL